MCTREATDCVPSAGSWTDTGNDLSLCLTASGNNCNDLIRSPVAVAAGHDRENYRVPMLAVAGWMATDEGSFADTFCSLECVLGARATFTGGTSAAPSMPDNSQAAIAR